MKNVFLNIILIFNMFLVSCNGTDESNSELPARPKTPVMGWASWNNYRININEDIIKAQADAMVATGMKDAGYQYINVDDGFFGGRDEYGELLVHPERFPGGMKALAEYIHSKGLKAGIYTDAGINTCATYWDKDTIGVGVGLWGHDEKDLELFLKEWDYDFIKVDWCGGEWLGLDEKTRYSEIGELVYKLKPEAVYNVCRWQFPGKWVTSVADSWRISPDIANTFESVMGIIDLNADLWCYAGPGHVNDMDMLQVGRGMSLEEDKTHFAMWCMMCSPLIAGNDLTTLSEETLEILTNEELIAINQDPLVYQARRVVDMGDLEVWAKPLKSTMSGEVAVALLNRSEETQVISVNLRDIGIDSSFNYAYEDIWKKEKFKFLSKQIISKKVPPHGVAVLRIEGTALPFNVFQSK
ncbi:glycoside hydrolase family 27 protein [Marinilabilia rubra]|uniref:Alpha-galactosidase n=1 Tax=Marinilabilia rubra TaxID=2162893 RepID=A0A2U2B754_9BACT|nr:glycoside hydrolase family 27 protein [Marinilabilia rubra]PWD98876.1 alpha-galactosidase [Marinilabilia rubra]